MGHHRSYLGMLLRSETIEPANHEAVARVYDELSMTWSTSVAASRVIAAARRRAYAPPLAWDDHELDDPDAKPYGQAARKRRASDDFDVDVVENILAGEWKTPSTKAERREVCRRWHDTGRPLAELGRLTGWKPERYFVVRQDGAA